MDTEHPEVRVLVTDVELVWPNGNTGGQLIAWISDANGHRFAAGVGTGQQTGPVVHYALSTPIALPVGSPLHVDVSTTGVEVNRIGRVVNI